MAYEHQAANQSMPSFWEEFFSLFHLQRQANTPLPFGRSVALLVGIGHYKHITPSLDYISSDVVRMRDFLLGDGGFDAVYVMPENVQPETVNAWMAEDKFPIALTSKDRLLFYYSGHGGELNRRTPFLLFQDAEPGKFGHAVLRVDSNEDWSLANPAKHILFVYDACYAGRAYSKSDDKETADSIADLSGEGSRVVVTAGTADQRSWVLQTSAAQQHSIFTDAFLKALQEGLADHDRRGFITIRQVIGETEPLVSAATRSLGSGHEMSPDMVKIGGAERPGTFVFLNRRVDKPSVPTGDARFLGVALAKSADPTLAAQANDLDRQVELRAWDTIKDSSDPEDFRLFCNQYARSTLCPFAQRKIAQLAKNVPLSEPPANPRSGDLTKAPRDLTKLSLADLSALASQGDSKAQLQLGKIYQSETQGASLDVPKAIDSLTKAANAGEGEAAQLLGRIYMYGAKGVAIDLPKSAQWFQRGTDLGDPTSTNGLGYLYEFGQGLPKDVRKAVELYKKAADLGDARGMANLGSMYQSGLGGLTQDDRKAVELLQKAADLGDAHGMTNLGVMYEGGRGRLARDERKAVELYQKAADLGDAHGMAALGVMYEYAKGGLTADRQKAIELYRKADQLGSTYAADQLKRLGLK
jgi:TPR repeat protein